MILERAELLVKDGMAEEFAAALRERGLALLARGKGCRSVRVGHGIETPNRFLLLLEWDSVEAHVAFTKTEDHAAFRGLIGPFAAGGSMEHFAFD